MKTYRVIGRSIDVRAGLVALTPAQAKTRMHNLKARADGVYEVLKPIQFKHGEAFGYDGEFPKAMVDVLADPEAEAKAKAEAEATAAGPAESAGPDGPAGSSELDLAAPAAAAAPKGAPDKKGAGKK